MILAFPVIRIRIQSSIPGIGKETARVLAGRGARVIMACRDIKKAEEAAKSIRESRPKSNIAVMHLDLCSLSSVRSFAHRILEHEERLDILLNNAGISGGKFKLTEDGFEEIYQANYLGPFYLTELLMPLLKKSAPARILNVGSTAYLMGSVSLRTFLEDIRRMNTTSGARYGDSKLAMLMWTKAIAKELEDSGKNRTESSKFHFSAFPQSMISWLDTLRGVNLIQENRSRSQPYEIAKFQESRSIAFIPVWSQQR